MCLIFYWHWILYFHAGHWAIGTRIGQLRYQFWFPNFRDTAKGRPFGPFNASKWANYFVPKSSRLNTGWSNVTSLKDWSFVHICENLNTLDTQLHHKLSQIILSSDTKQNIQLIELLLILKKKKKTNQVLVWSLLYGMWTSLSAVSSSVSKPEATASFSHWKLLATCSEGDSHMSICGLFPVLLTTQCPSVEEVAHFSFHQLIITGRLHQSPFRSPLNCYVSTCLTGPVVLCMSYMHSYELEAKRDDLRQTIYFYQLL